jgi:hypothetical protein
MSAYESGMTPVSSVCYPILYLSFYSIINVAYIHLMDCHISIPLMGRFSVSTASLVLLYKEPLLAL